MKHNENTKKREGLDALRGIGITGIVLYHLFPAAFRGGFLGVPLFFVLSGYLMFLTAGKRSTEGGFRVGDYYKKRLKRIVPPLFTMVMAVCCYLTLTKSSQMAGIRQEIASIFLGYDNWWQIKQNASYFSGNAGASPFTHLWFLAVELQFYLIWPLLYTVYRKGCELIGGRKMCFLFLALALLSISKMFYLYSPGEDPSRVYYGTDTMAFPLLIGMFLGAIRENFADLCHPVNKQSALPACFLSVLVVCLLFVTVDGQDPFLYRGGMFAVSLFYAAIIHLIENLRAEPSSPERLSRLLALLGQKSYGIYLWHYPIIILALVPVL